MLNVRIHRNFTISHVISVTVFSVVDALAVSGCVKGVVENIAKTVQSQQQAQQT